MTDVVSPMKGTPMTGELTLATTADPIADPARPASSAAHQGQTRIVLGRFLGHRLAVVALVVLVLIALFSLSSSGIGPIPGWWPYDHTQLNAVLDGGRPTLSVLPHWLGGSGMHLGVHPFGQDRIGRDYFAMTMRGIQNSMLVMIIVAAVSVALGTVIGGLAGYYGGWLDTVLMRMTDLVMIIPMLVIAAVLGQIAGNLGGPAVLAVLLGALEWPNMARLVRAEFLSYREREFVDAAHVASVPDPRIIFKHIMPNAIGVVIVAGTLTMASAVLLESSLSYLGLGIRAPDVSLGGLISQNETSAVSRPWLFWWPGCFIILLALAVNFVGDGLRDAFDPRQRRFRPRRLFGTAIKKTWRASAGPRAAAGGQAATAAGGADPMGRSSTVDLTVGEQR